MVRSNVSGIWVYIQRKCTLDDDSLIKARKKAKGTTGFAFNPTVFKAFLPLEALLEQNATEVLLRVPLQQKTHPEDYELDIEKDCPVYENLSEAYLRIHIHLSEPLNPEITDYQIDPSSLLPKQSSDSQQSKSDSILLYLKEAVKEEVILLATEFYELFVKGVENEEEEDDHSATPHPHRIVNATLNFNDGRAKRMRKDNFVESFKKGLGYQDMKERFTHIIKKICMHNINIIETLNGVTKTEKDKVFSELFAFLSTATKEALNIQIKRSTDEAYGNIISSKEHAEKRVYEIVKATVGETKKKRFLNLCDEYIRFGRVIQAINRAKTLVKEGNDDVIPKYSNMLLQNFDYITAEEYIGVKLLKEANDEESLLILLLIYMSKGRYPESRVIVKKLTEINNQSILICLLNYLVFKNLDKEQLALKFVALAKRIKQRELKKISNKPHEQAEDLGIGKIPTPLTAEEIDDMWVDCSRMVIEYNFPSIGQLFFDEIKDKESSKSKLVEIEMVRRQGLDNKVYTLLRSITQTFPENLSLLELYMKNCLKLGKLKKAERLLIKLVGMRHKKIEMLIHLGNLKLTKRQYVEARIVFYKVVEITKTSITAWIGLGKACIELKDFSDACEALKYANILDPLNPEVWVHLTKISLEDESRRNEFIFCFRELSKLNLEEVDDEGSLSELVELFNANGLSDYSILIWKKYTQAMYLKTEPEEQKIIRMGDLNFKLGKLYYDLNNVFEARKHLLKAQEHNPNSPEIESIQDMLRDIGDIGEDIEVEVDN